MLPGVQFTQIPKVDYKGTSRPGRDIASVQVGAKYIGRRAALADQIMSLRRIDDEPTTIECKPHRPKPAITQKGNPRSCRYWRVAG